MNRTLPAAALALLCHVTLFMMLPPIYKNGSSLPHLAPTPLAVHLSYRRPPAAAKRITQPAPPTPEPAGPIKQILPRSAKISPEPPKQVQTVKKQEPPAERIPESKRPLDNSNDTDSPRDKVVADSPAAAPDPDVQLNHTQKAANPAATGAAKSTKSDSTTLAQPLYQVNPPPRYPAKARKRNYQGTVILSVLVSTTGEPADMKIYSSSGHSILDRAAMHAVKQWRFEPGEKNHVPAAMWVRIPVTFKLD